VFFGLIQIRLWCDMIKQCTRDGGNIIDRLIECGLIRARRDTIAADLTHELQRGIVQFFIGWRTVGLAKFANVSAHDWIVSSFDRKEKTRRAGEPFGSVLLRRRHPACALRRRHGFYLAAESFMT